MKFLVGIISGIVLSGAGVAVVSSQAPSASAGTVTPQVSSGAQAVAAPHSVARRMQGLSGELSRQDTGAFELKVTARQNGELVERDVRLLVAHAKVSNRAGRTVRLPLDDANARVTGSMLPRSAWRVDDDGQPTPTFAATHIVIAATNPSDQTDQAQRQDTHNEQLSTDAQDTHTD